MQNPTIPARNDKREIRIFVFVDDKRLEPGTDWRITIASGGVPVDVNWVGPNQIAIGRVSDKCTLRFRAGANEAVFTDVGANLLNNGGELIVAFVENLSLLDKDVSVTGSNGLDTDAPGTYDDARVTVCDAWRRTPDSDQKRVRRAVFYNFVPDTDNDPNEVTGYYFELAN